VSTDRKPLSKRIEAEEAVRNISVPISLEVKLVTSSKLSEMGLLEHVLDLALKDVKERFTKEGFVLHVAGGSVRPMAQDELLALLPRKMHLTLNGGESQACKTEYVARKQLTEDHTKVTCKRCLARIAGL
jgi:hypothetical protein